MMHMPMRLVLVITVLVVATIFRVAVGQVVVMEMKEALQKKHRQKTTKHPRDSPVKRV